jgi:glycosyltransferase involved in cell wall biosynthesis
MASLSPEKHSVEFADFRIESKLFKKRNGFWGDVAQQIQAMQAKTDLVFSGSADVTRLLCRMRGMKMFSSPIVNVIHHNLRYGRPWERWVNKVTAMGCDLYLPLSGLTRSHLVERVGLPESKVRMLQWGPDLDFYGDPSGLGDEVVAAGKTGRDYPTLLNAVGHLEVKTTIVCDLCPPVVPNNVQIVASGRYGSNPYSYKELLQLYRRSFVVAVPLRPWNCLLGLTSVLDAMAAGRAVICTRNPFLDLDIAKEGCGIWVDPGDVQGWRNSIMRLFRNRAEAEEMGMRGREICEEKLNLTHYSQQLEHALTDVLTIQ